MITEEFRREIEALRQERNTLLERVQNHAEVIAGYELRIAEHEARNLKLIAELRSRTLEMKNQLSEREAAMNAQLTKLQQQLIEARGNNG